MCGRYAVTTAPEAMRALFRYLEQPNFPSRHNVAPTQPVAIVRMVEGKRRFALVRWGLIPPWVEDPRGFSLLINARGESVLDKPAFRNAMKRRRCLFPADGFYEWKQEGIASSRISCGSSPDSRWRSQACGRPGAGRMARNWRRPPS
jgi:putative SOS response-associated peptidase YedK